MVDKNFTGTYARIILSDWSVLAKMISNTDDPRLSQVEIDEALNGPLGNFFRQKIAAYAKIMIGAHELAKSSEEAFKPLVDDKLPLKSGAEIDKALLALSDLTEQHYQEWLENWEQFSQNLIKSLSQKKVILNAIESEDLSRRELLSELYKRFQDLQLNLPKLKSPIMNLEHYLYFKTYLAIQSALSRQHLPHQSADIEAVLKSMKKDFQAIAQAEKTLLKKQEKS
jgi:hypothetical protein